jgi:hypothetical protein
MPRQEPQYTMQLREPEEDWKVCVLCEDVIEDEHEDAIVSYRPSDDAPEEEWKHFHSWCYQDIQVQHRTLSGWRREYGRQGKRR